MNATLEPLPPKAKYDINQTCSLLGIHRDSLRKYTEVTHDIECCYRKIGGQIRKFYLGEEIERFFYATIDKTDTNNNDNRDNGN